jgi:hypothetical protein
MVMLLLVSHLRTAGNASVSLHRIQDEALLLRPAAGSHLVSDFGTCLSNYAGGAVLTPSFLNIAQPLGQTSQITLSQTRVKVGDESLL